MHTPQLREKNQNIAFGAFVVGLNNKAITSFFPLPFSNLSYSPVPLKHSMKLSHLLHTYAFFQK